MSLKKDLAREITILEKEMQELESKRSRSIAALMESVISKVEPDATEMQFFRQYTAEIDVKREKIIDMTNQLKNMM
ncbi:MAG: hypothetical protein J1G38_01535 [Clostridiales bacterium]|nr:hypothetical protein [Clostridiales bacterium]